jgi:hypothetical protein
MKVTLEITLKDILKQMWWVKWNVAIHRNTKRGL